MATAAPRRSWVEQVMGLPVSVLARGALATAGPAAEAVQAVFAELTAVDGLFSPYLADSAVSRLNRGETTVADLPADVAEVVTRCQAAKARTGGLFDATMPDGGWDPSGLVKGWAVERAARHLAAAGEIDWCLNAGGDVVVLTPSGEAFSVGIQDPMDRQRVAAVVPLARGALATSGTAARGAHIYDPRTGGATASTWLSVSVLGPSLETADVLATAAFVAGDAWASVTEQAPGYAALAISASGQLVRTTGWPLAR